ncbi:YkgJ family cysteine cluster protein [Vibrio aestuarianus]|uniref:YkgJ family cysteine cluster protein n=1 Tax=Vibrio aestuarianus TaxID=28171 RepID=UPI00237CBC1E|nr:YkgJ family cysteine cluster protein [Vibrio aestuarianus]MDE1232284.1 YkgJ family cysteine cluster protein [Vibrio aestuarianus]
MTTYSIDVSDWSPCISDSLKKGCGACCIAPSITSPIPGMPEGKPAGTRCVQLNEDNLCSLFGKPERPKVCHDFTSDDWICHKGPEYALQTLSELESLT